MKQCYCYCLHQQKPEYKVGSGPEEQGLGRQGGRRDANVAGPLMKNTELELLKSSLLESQIDLGDQLS